MFEVHQAYCWHILVHPLSDFCRGISAFERLDYELRQLHRPTTSLVHPFFMANISDLSDMTIYKQFITIIEYLCAKKNKTKEEKHLK